jgi:gliding motility-associated-like protein
VLTCTATSISLTATGGGTYSWSNGTTVVGSNAALSVSSPATYTVTVTAANGCTETESVTITQNCLIDAVNDTYGPINGLTGSTTGSVLTNDQVDGSLVVPSGINLTFVSGAPQLTLNPNGTISIAPGTPAGTYSLTYQICVAVNPTFCDQATATITVAPAVIDAVVDTYGPINGYTGSTTASVLANDLLNGVVVIPSQVTLTSVTVPTGLTLNANGTITIAPGTPAGTYTVTYQICENLNPTNCDQATATVTVAPAVIDAVVDTYGPINGYTGSTTASVLANDLLNGVVVIPSQVTLTSVTVPTGLTLNANGTITIAPGTPAGTYTVTYQICENLNPTNCDQATATVTVVNNPPEANTDTASTDEDNLLVIDVVGNDTDNDGDLNPGSVTVTNQPDNGTVTVDPITGEITYTPNPNWNGTDTLIYQICDFGTPVLCDTAVVIITVNPINDAPVANQDLVSTDEVIPVVIDVTPNDTDIDGNIDPTTVNVIDGPNNGSVTVDPLTGEITYTPNPGFVGVDTLIYNVCDDGTPLPVQCDTAMVIITVTPCLSNPALDCDGDGVTNGDELADGTDPSNPCSLILTSSTLATSTVWLNSDCDDDGVTNGQELNDGTDPLDPCEYDSTSITLPQLDLWLNSDCDGDGVTNADELEDGTDPNNPCDLVILSQTVTPSDVWLAGDCDNDGITNGEELENGNNPFDPCDPNPSLASCITDIFIPQAFTPNADGDNDYFEIVGLENYPVNQLTIFNRWGSVVYQTDNYTNDWQGTANVNMTLGGESLPTGTYFYLLDLKQEGMEIFKGYVYLQR